MSSYPATIASTSNVASVAFLSKCLGLMFLLLVTQNCQIHQPESDGQIRFRHVLQQGTGLNIAKGHEQLQDGVVRNASHPNRELISR